MGHYLVHVFNFLLNCFHKVYFDHILFPFPQLLPVLPTSLPIHIHFFFSLCLFVVISILKTFLTKGKKVYINIEEVWFNWHWNYISFFSIASTKLCYYDANQYDIFCFWKTDLVLGRLDLVGPLPIRGPGQQGVTHTCFPEGASWGCFTALLAAQELPVHEEAAVVLDKQVGVAPYLWRADRKDTREGDKISADTDWPKRRMQ